MKVKIGQLDLVKGNLYTDSHKQTVYVDKKKKIGYIIPKKWNGVVRVISEKTLVAILVGLLAWGEWGLVVGGICFVSIFASLFIALKIILKQFDCGDVEEIPADRTVEESLKDESKTALLLKGFATFALVAALIIYTVFFAHFDLKSSEGMISIVAVIATTIYAMYISINFIRVALKK